MSCFETTPEMERGIRARARHILPNPEDCHIQSVLDEIFIDGHEFLASVPDLDARIRRHTMPVPDDSGLEDPTDDDAPVPVPAENEGRKQTTKNHSANDRTTLRLHHRKKDTGLDYGTYVGAAASREDYFPVLIHQDALVDAMNGLAIIIDIDPDDVAAQSEMARAARRRIEIERRVREAVEAQTPLIRVLCRGGAILTGRSLDNIARDTFGMDAFYKPTPEDPEVLGKMLSPIPGETGAWWVCAIILEITEIPGGHI